MTSDEIMEHYYAYAMDGSTLIPYIAAVLDRRYGPCEKEPLLGFLDRLEMIIFGNIDDRYDEGPGLQVDVDHVRKEAAREIDQARTLVLESMG